MAEIIQLRRGTAAQWASVNPVLAQGEPGLETDTNKEKRGNGVTAWNSLPYFFTPSATLIADQITAAGVKTVPVDADYFPITDSAAGNVLKKLSWASIKAMFNALYASATHTHSAGDINSGTLATGRGGTGLTGFSASNYLRALNATTLENRTPAQVLADIGAQPAGSYAAATHGHGPSAVVGGGTFGAGDYLFPSKLSVDGQGGSLIQVAGNSGTALTIDWNTGNIHTVTLNGNCTLTLSNPVAGFPYTLLITMDGTLRTLSWPVTVKWVGSVVPILSGINKKDSFTLIWDGTIYWAIPGSNFG